MFRSILTGLLLSLASSLAATERDVSSSQALTPKHFARLQALSRPEAGEDKWAEIPWLTSLWQARERGAAEGKPILLWEMDGHPLGCT